MDKYKDLAEGGLHRLTRATVLLAAIFGNDEHAEEAIANLLSHPLSEEALRDLVRAPLTLPQGALDTLGSRFEKWRAEAERMEAKAKERLRRKEMDAAEDHPT